MVPQPFLGELRIFNSNRIPRDWMPCNGQILAMIASPPLFSLLEARYGGNGYQTFGIPNLQNAATGSSLVFCLATEGMFPPLNSGTGNEPATLLGQIRLFNAKLIPADFLACQGQLLPIGEHQELFALLGTRFGGDGQETFALPNLAGNDPDADSGYAIAIRGPLPDMEELLAE